MARKKKETENYFGDFQEDMFIKFVESKDERERNEIFKNYLEVPFTTMIESIIRRYSLFVPNEEFSDTLNDTMSNLLTKVSNFSKEKGCKAYSYCGTICKNYLVWRRTMAMRDQNTNIQYEDAYNDLYNDDRFMANITETKTQELNNLIEASRKKVLEMVDNPEKYSLNEKEIKVGKSLAYIIENWETMFFEMGSNKFNKSSVIYYLKEMTGFTTTEIRNSMKKFKDAYFGLKTNNYVED